MVLKTYFKLVSVKWYFLKTGINMFKILSLMLTFMPLSTQSFMLKYSDMENSYCLA